MTSVSEGGTGFRRVRDLGDERWHEEAAGFDLCQYSEARVAKARGIKVDQVEVLVNRFRLGRDLGFLSEPRVNVSQLPLAPDQQNPLRTGR